jgi:hypothetical protein
MFATLKALNILKRQYGLEVEAVITDIRQRPCGQKQRGASL